LLGLTVLGCSSSSVGLDKSFDRYKHLFATINGTDHLILYEGLPGSYEDEWELQLKEKQTKQTVTLSDDLFYTETLDLRAEDAQALKAILGSSSRFRSYQENKCDYHADYGVEWSAGGIVHRCHLCFGCNHAKIYTSGGGMWCTMPPDTYTDLRAILERYRKNRPGNPQKGWHGP
jgi:hypothetical protein